MNEKTGQFKLVSHTADVRVNVSAGSKEELFKNALLGMNEILKKDYCHQEDNSLIVHDIEVASYDMTALLVDFLSQVLTHSHIHKAIFCYVEFSELTENYAIARLTGSRVEKFDKDIKGVSYYGAEVVMDKNGIYHTTVIFDI